MIPQISLFALLISLLPILAIIWIGHRWAGTGREVLYASLRMLVQLLAVGFALVFVFNAPSPSVGAGVTVLMVLAASLIGIRTIHTQRFIAFRNALISIGGAGTLVLVFVLYGVLQLEPVYQPRMIIPLAGMIYSNAMTAITLAAERLERETVAGSTRQAARSAAWTAALIPQINTLFAVGIVSLPGMMTGQILSGVDPLIAVRYQVVVMAMILQSAGFSVAVFLLLSRNQFAAKT